MDKWRIFGAAVVGALVVSGVLGGCDPGGEPVVTETPSASASASAVVTPTPSASAEVSTSPSASPGSRAWVLERLPKDALYPDIGGAIKAGEFFLSLYAPMFHSGDTQLWDSLSGPDCGYCADASANAREVVEGGWLASGGEITADLMTEDSAMDGDEAAIVSFEADFADAYLASARSTPELQEVASRHRVYLKMTFADGLWLIDGVMVDDK